MIKTLLLTICFAVVVFASSHSEAPGTAKRTIADVSDFYMFRSYEAGRENYVTFIGNFYPMIDPFGGPNYFSPSDNYFYEFYIDQNGDCKEDITFQLYNGQTLAGPTVTVPYEPEDDECIFPAPPTTRGVAPQLSQNINGGISLNIGGKNVAIALKTAGQITASDQSNLNWIETFYLNVIYGDRYTGQVYTITNANGGGSSFTKPFDYSGQKTFPDYNAYANQYIYDINIPQCSGPGRVFVGQRAEPFYINLGPIFDLVNFVPIDGYINQTNSNNQLRFKNIISLVMEVPTSCVQGSQTDVIGAWWGVRELYHKGNQHLPGRQFSRLGNPLINEIFIGLRDKSRFNHYAPVDDVANGFDVYIKYPTFPAILNILLLSAVNGLYSANFTTIAPTNFPRNDLYVTLFQGLPGINQPISNGPGCDLLRLNVSIPITPYGSQNTLGVIAGDAAGYPNGRRLGDDIVDIDLRVAMGNLCYLGLGLCNPADANIGTAPLTDGAPIQDTDFQSGFPYVNAPIPGNFLFSS